MKKNLHPITQKTVFQDVVTGEAILVESTIETGESVLWEDGNTYPLVKVEVSSSSHPAYTNVVVEERPSSRAEKFKQKYDRVTIH